MQSSIYLDHGFEVWSCVFYFQCIHFFFQSRLCTWSGFQFLFQTPDLPLIGVNYFHQPVEYEPVWCHTKKLENDKTVIELVLHATFDKLKIKIKISHLSSIALPLAEFFLIWSKASFCLSNRLSSCKKNKFSKVQLLLVKFFAGPCWSDDIHTFNWKGEKISFCFTSQSDLTGRVITFINWN